MSTPPTPWNPPANAESFTVRRRTPDGTWVQCSAEYQGGEVRTRHLCKGLSREFFVALWGGGDYEVTFHAADGKAAGRGLVKLTAEAKPAAATLSAIAAAVDAVEPPADEEGAEEVVDEERPLETEADVDERRAEREELARLRRENEELRRQGETLAAQAPPRPMPPRPKRAESTSIPGLSGPASEAFALFFHLRDMAAAEADQRIERFMLLEDSRRRDDEAKHKREMAEYDARHTRWLETERTLTNRLLAPQRETIAELKGRIAELEGAEPEVETESPVIAELAKSIPIATEALGHIAKGYADKKIAGG